MRRRRRRLSESSRLGRADGLLVTTVVGSVLAIGTVHVPVLLVVAPLAVLAGVLALSGDEDERVPVMAVVLAALATYTLVQAIPLPFGLVAHVAPASGDIWARALHPFGEGKPSFASLSVDPGATFTEALKWWAYAAVFLAAASFGRRRGIEYGALVILGSATALSLCCIVHGLLNATRVYGFYTPRFGGSGWVIGPLINHNNRAGYLNLGALAGLGLLALPRPLLPRWALALSVATNIGVSVNTGSRGGLAALLVGLVVALFATRSARDQGARGASSYRYTVAAIALAVAGGAAFALAASTRYTGQLLTDRNLKKLELVQWVLPVLRDHPLFGVGRGAFESAFPAYRTGPDNLVYVAPENFVLQWASEWGLPVSALALGASLWLLRPRAWGLSMSSAAGGLFAGVVALVLQNLLDLSLELPSVAIAATASAGFSWGHARREGGNPEALSLPRFTPWLGLGIGLALTALVATRGIRTLTRDRDEVHAAFPRETTDPAALATFRTLLREAMTRHPAEPYFPRAGALLAVRARDQNPMPWLERALERAVTSGRSNFLLASFLASRGYRDQALMQIKLAVREDPNLTPHAAKLVLLLARGETDVWKAVPEDLAGAPLLRALSRAVTRTDEPFALELLEEAAEREPKDKATEQALSQELLAALEKGDASVACGGPKRESCRKRAAAHIAKFDELSFGKQESLALRARFLRVDGRAGEAVRLLSERCPSVAPRALCLRAWLSIAASARDRDSALRAAILLERDACIERTACAAALSEIGDTLAPEDPTTALTYLMRAAREDATRARWIRAAQVARAAGQNSDAIRALEAATSLGGDPEGQRALEREKLQIMTETRERKP